MSLQIWLPLNGNLKNNGCDGGTVSSVNASTSTSGKIGSCYSFNGSSSYLLGTHSFLSNSTPDWSFACWMKLNSTSAGQCLFSCRTIADQRGISVFYYGSTWLIDDGVRWQFTPTVTIAANKWYHVCVVHKKDVGKYLYIDGSLDSSTTTTSTPTLVSTTNFAIGNSQTSSTAASNNPLNGYLNDVRIYDHALSVAEVKELAKGLVCHYKLDNNGESNPNLVARTNVDDTSRFGYSEQTGGSTKTIEYDGSIPCIKVTRNSTTHSGWAYMWHTGLANSLIKTSTTYTVSFDAIASGSGSVSFNGFMNGNATNNLSASTSVIQGTFNANGWSHIVLRTTTKSSFDDLTVGGQVVYMGCSYMNNVNVWIMIKNMKVEEGSMDTPWCPYQTDDKYIRLGYGSTTINDCSGNGYNATKGGTLTASTNTPRYSVCTVFAASSGCFSNPNIILSQFTISFWGKHTAANKMLMGSNASLSSTNTNWYWYGDNSFKYPSGEFYYAHNAGSAESLLGTWIHFVAVYDGANITIYRNGVNEGSKAVTGDMTLTYLSVGIGFNQSSYWAGGSVSDFRLYATALTANDIRKMYTRVASMFKNGSLLGYEFNEVT